MFCYNKIWALMDEKGISQYQLIEQHNISRSTLDRLRNNMPLETSTLEKLCDILNCQPGDFIENLPTEKITTRPALVGRGGRKSSKTQLPK